MAEAMIRRFHPSDASMVSTLVRRNLMEINSKDYPMQKMELLARMYGVNKILDMNEYASIVVACIGDGVVGCGAIARYWGRPSDSILLTIFVLPEYQRQGIGRKIVKALECDELFSQTYRTEVPSSITAREFYLKLGYTDKNGLAVLDDEGTYRMEKYHQKA